MKIMLKSFVKLFFVVLLPIIVTITLGNLTLDRSDSMITGDHYLLGLGLLTILIGTYINCIFFASFMSKTDMLPKFKFEFAPVFGLALAVDTKGYGKGMAVLVVLPFFTIELKWV